MRIGIVTSTYLPSRNGVATSTHLLACGLRNLGHEVHVFAPRHPDAQASEEGLHRLNSSFFGARAFGAPEDYPVMLSPGPILTSKLPWRNLDILHTMHPFLAGSLALRWAKSLGIGVVYTAHTQYDQYLHYVPVPRRISSSVVRSHVADFSGKVSKVLAPGTAMLEMLRGYGFSGDVEIFPNPVDTSSFEAASGAAFREKHNIHAGVPLVMYLGRLAPEKNLDVMLEAFYVAKQSRPDIKLLVVGDGVSGSNLEAKAGTDVIFAGAISYDQVPEALAAADVFITASTSEVLPMSMIEALAAGTPLVAARSSAALDLIKEGVNGSIREASAEALAAGLLEVLSPNVLASYQNNARQSAAAYDIAERALTLEGIYAEVIYRNKLAVKRGAQQ